VQKYRNLVADTERRMLKLSGHVIGVARTLLDNGVCSRKPEGRRKVERSRLRWLIGNDMRAERKNMQETKNRGGTQ
jgi:hypothetical protein